MNQLIIACHVPATGTITLNGELDGFRHVRLQDCKVWPTGTGLALRDWLRSRDIEPPMLKPPNETSSVKPQRHIGEASPLRF